MTVDRSVRYHDGVRVDVTARHGVASPLPTSALVRAIAAALQAGEAPLPASVSLILTDDAEISGLNEQHMGHEGPTDVLCFPMLPPSAYPPHPGQDPALRSPRPAYVRHAAGRSDPPRRHRGLGRAGDRAG